jgi:hypothetical protein
VSFLRGGNWTSDLRERPRQEVIQQRWATRSDHLAEATVACACCDAPVAVGSEPLTMSDSLTCPFCGHRGPVRDFVSLAKPTRPTHAVLRVRFVDAH